MPHRINVSLFRETLGELACILDENGCYRVAVESTVVAIEKALDLYEDDEAKKPQAVQVQLGLLDKFLYGIDLSTDLMHQLHEELP